MWIKAIFIFTFSETLGFGCGLKRLSPLWHSGRPAESEQTVVVSPCTDPAGSSVEPF